MELMYGSAFYELVRSVTRFSAQKVYAGKLILRGKKDIRINTDIVDIEKSGNTIQFTTFLGDTFTMKTTDMIQAGIKH